MPNPPTWPYITPAPNPHREAATATTQNLLRKTLLYLTLARERDHPKTTPTALAWHRYRAKTFLTELLRRGTNPHNLLQVEREHRWSHLEVRPP